MSKPFIPVLDLAPEISSLREELDEAYHRVMDHGRFIMGPEVDAFEKEVADYIGVKYAIGVNSGTDALLIALRAAGIGQGDEVITTPFTFFATVESIDMAGAAPVFVDIREDDFNIDPDLIEAAITDKTKAIVPVHLFGKPAAMDLISGIAERYNLKFIEDCAQSFGAPCNETKQKTGAIGEAGAFSFFPSKNLGGFGDGGMITTNDESVAELSRKLRAHGSVKKYHNEMMGYNSRLDTLQAAMLQVKLRHIDRFNKKRRDVARRYIDAFNDLEALQAPSLPDSGHVYHQFTIRVLHGERDNLAAFLDSRGIGSMVYYPVPCHHLPVFGEQYASLDLPVTDRVKNEVLSLPIGPFLPEKDQERVIEEVHTYFSS